MNLVRSIKRFPTIESLLILGTLASTPIIGYISTHSLKITILLVEAIALLMIFVFRWYIVIFILAVLGSIISFGAFSVRGTTISLDYFIVPLFIRLLFTKRESTDLNRGMPRSAWLIFFTIILVNFFRNPRLPQLFGGTPDASAIGLAYFAHGLTLLCSYLIVPLVLSQVAQLKRFLMALALFSLTGLVFSWIYYLYGFLSIFVPGYAGIVFFGETSLGNITRFGWIGNYASYLLPLALVFLPNRWTLFKVGVIALLLVSILISGGRVQLLAFFASLLIYVYLLTRQSWLVAATLGSIILVYLVVFDLKLNETYPVLNRFSFAYTMENARRMDQGISASRLGVYQSSLQLIAQNPIFGVGPSSAEQFKQYRVSYQYDSFALARQGTHATFINIPTILGVPALLVYLIALSFSLRRALGLVKYRPSSEYSQISEYLILAIAQNLILFFFSGSFYGGTLFFFIVLGMIDAVYILQRNELNHKE